MKIAENFGKFLAILVFSLVLSSFKIPYFFSGSASSKIAVKAITDTTKDSTRYNPRSPSSLNLKDPANFRTELDYDPVKNLYIVRRLIGNTVIETQYFTPEEYKKTFFEKEDQKYWTEKSGSGSGLRDRNTGGDPRDNASALLPLIEVKGETFKNIFGSNTIEIRPQGSATLTLGGRFQRLENPMIPVRNRRTFNLVFNQRIQMNVNGRIGTRLNLGFNYDTQATFAFDNQIKTQFTGEEDQILKKLEFGNVNMPLNSSLITGVQSLFGIKAQMQFGKTTVTTVFSEQRSQTSSINLQGGGAVQEFFIQADQYEANRHYFLSHYFRANYERFLNNLPVITSPVQITRIEVWVTNRRNVTENVRNIVAFMDLGEADIVDWAYRNTQSGPAGPDIFSGTIDRRDPELPHNQMNKLNPTILQNEYPGIRNIAQANALLTQAGFEPGIDFEDLTNARLLSPNEYTFHPQLGYISLNQALNQDEVLAVAFQYTANGKTYQVGEFSNDGVSPPATLVLKLLKATLLNVRVPIWHLMMKNVYSLNAFQINPQDFKLDVLYWNDETGVPIPFLPEGNLRNELLLRVMGLDRLNNNNDPFPDGFFDFVPNVTINPQTGRIYFPVVEPFGRHLASKLENDELRQRYVFQQLYDSTRFRAQEMTKLNKFFLRGRYKSASGSEIQLNAINIPRGSVSVTAGGVKLQEGTQYTVDYNLGRVRILDEGIINSGLPIRVDFENNALFGANVKSFAGINVDHRVSEHWNIGGTLLHLRERPFTQKVNLGFEPIANTIWGLNTQYSKEAPILTKLVDALPFISTKAPSTINAQGEFAQLIPGSPRAIKLDREETTYIDDFESSQTLIDIRNPMRWQLASIPSGQSDLFPESELNNDIRIGFNRARIAWYTIDPLFFQANSQTPANVRADRVMRSNHYMREILVKEVFPNRRLDPAMPRNIPTLDIAYYPEERGPYNFDVEGEPGISAGLNSDGKLNNPRSRWGGIMRELLTNNFEEQNIEFIQFWLLDPFLEDPTLKGGDLYINLGNISEDILKDGRQAFEQGLPIDGNFAQLDSTAWGYVPKIVPQVQAFNNEPGAREVQDVGMDGLNDELERQWFKLRNQTFLERLAAQFGTGSAVYNAVFNDPAADNYEFYRSNNYDNLQADILERYKKWNNPQGNSDISQPDGYPNTATNRPDMEDVNMDQTLQRSETYFQYRISIRPQDLQVGRNHITDVYQTTTDVLPDGSRKPVTWYQFKVPIFTPDKVIGPISDFRSIRFIRLFLHNWENPIVLRFAAFELVRGEWRRYPFSLSGMRDDLANDDSDGTLFEVNVVNLEENGQRVPINYVLPPGIERQELFATSSIQQQDEQSLAIRVCDLKDGDARAVFRNLAMDMRLYKRLRMFVHAEARDLTNPLRDGDLTAFIRLGADFSQNYYEYEIPLVVTQWGEVDPRQIWPLENEFDIDLDEIRKIKLERDRAGVPLQTRFTVDRGGRKITIVGVPNLGNVRTIMIGVRNPKKQLGDPNDDGLPKCAEIWVNELRLGGFDNRGGYAAAGRVNAQLADFANITLTGNYSTVGFGSIDQNVNARSKEEIIAYDLQSNFELGKFFSEKVRLRIPMFFGYAEEWRNPMFNPLDMDIEFPDALRNLETNRERDSLRRIAQTYTLRRGINFANVRKERTNTKRKPQLYDIENFALSYSFNEIYFRDINTVSDVRRDYKGALNYNYQAQVKPVEPFKKIKFLQNKHLALIRDFNFNYMPSRFTFRTELWRIYNEAEMRNTDNPTFRLPTTYQKAFTFNRIYDLSWDLTKALRADFQARMFTRVDEPDGPSTADSVRNAIRENLLAGGRPTNYHHTLNVNYDLPFGKIPLLNFINASVRYTADYDWMSNSLLALTAVDNDSLNLGNTIQNSQSWQVNGQANLVNFYNKIKFFKEANQIKQPQRPGQQRPNIPANLRGNTNQNPSEKQQEEDKESVLRKFAKTSARILMTVRNVGGGYTLTRGTLLPGFMPQPELLGQQGRAPGLDFAFGSQKDIKPLAAENEWITKTPLLNNQFSNTLTENLNLRATLEPINTFRIELTSQRNSTFNQNGFFRFDATAFDYQVQNLFQMGTYTTSFWAFRTSFERIRGPEFRSDVYERFLRYREDVSLRLVNQRQQTDPTYNPTFIDNPDTSAYGWQGYSYASQDVLIPAFIAAFAGLDPKTIDLDPRFSRNSIPLPNWQLTYDGLNKIPFFNKHFTNIALRHGYTGTYTLGNFNTNLILQQRLEDGEPPINENGDFLPEFQIASATIVEQWSPLIGFNVRMKNSMTLRIDYKKDRMQNLSLANNQLTDSRGNEIVVGAGYVVKDVKLQFVSLGETGRKPQSNLELRADVSIRDNQVIIRRIVERVDQVTAGSRITTIKVSADYAISARVNAKVFYDQIISTYKTSNAFPTSNTNVGISIRVNLAQ
ncbi:T9SS outer membrane translocon Sov/SprA [Schleiferia thermophila]|uniref:T9SS outer membrane translocon Sov/SprA n=1 Tax=Schleiferia thermophila TaxID=884107 RepID=UPI0004E78A32|nr:cell surface protein SprA [Schleiferia thermophila]KFD39258.1 hypothetical protein AT05_05130 [Schleiferia thermophila str. Yellowstone]